MKILYEKSTGTKIQGEFREVDLSKKGIIIADRMNYSEYRAKKEKGYELYEKAEVQSKYLEEEEIKEAPKYILIKEGDE